MSDSNRAELQADAAESSTTDLPPMETETVVASGRISRRTLLIISVAALAVVALFFIRGVSRNHTVPVVQVPGLSPVVADLLADARGRVVQNPESGRSWGEYGMCLMQHERPQEALQCFEQAQQHDPHNPAWYYLSGVILEQTDLVRATVQLQKTVELRKDSMVARLRLASALMTLGEFDRASEQLQEVRLMSRNAADVWVQLVRLARLTGKPEQANSLLSEARKTGALTSTLLQETASAEMQLGHVEAATALIAEARQAPPFRPLPDPWMERLRTFDVSGAVASQQVDRLRERGQLNEAVRTLSTLSRRFPERSRPKLNLALTLRDQGQIPEAVTELEKLSRQFPDDPLIRFHLAITLAQAGNRDAALQQLNDCLKIKPDYGMARAVLGDLLDSREQVDEAIAAYQQAVRDSPADPWIRLGFVELLLTRGRKDEATRQLDAAKKVVSESQNAEMAELLRLEALVARLKSDPQPPANPLAQ